MMTSKRLSGPDALVAEVGKLFRGHQNLARLEVREDVGFAPDRWLDLGTLEVFPAEDDEAKAVQQGAFLWREPEEDELRKRLSEVLPRPESSEKKIKEAHERQIARILDGIECAKHRLGLLSPALDAYCFTEMPYRRPVTIVSDTTGVQQGALDFVARFLRPCARIKIPSVVQMEILLRADNYFKSRGKQKAGPSMVVDHILSQGGQRTLLRLEANPEVEVERAHLVDPLRGIIFPASDPEDKVLGIQDIHRSFADRLIFESARQHRSNANYGHPTLLLTSDQGLARMSIAEGLPALFFQSPKASHGRTLSGVQAHPFESRLVSTPLMAVVWEFAVCFGAARLCFADHTWVEVCALGNDVSWQPFHHREDLLWVSVQKGEIGSHRQPRTRSGDPSAAPPSGEPERPRSTESLPEKVERPGGQGAYSVHPQKLVKIADYFRTHQQIEPDLAQALGVGNPAGLEEVTRFLKAGEFVQDGASNDKMARLIEALDQRDLDTLVSLVSRVASFADFLATLEEKKRLKAGDVTKRAFEYYGDLAEVFGRALRIPEEGLYWAGRNPTPSEFVPLALNAYRKVSTAGQDFVLTGAWLEELVRSAQIHPLAAKARLQEAVAAEKLRRYFEGSTPETSYEKHRMLMFSSGVGKPQVVRVGLYRGDFLSEQKQSVSIKIEEGRQR